MFPQPDPLTLFRLAAPLAFAAPDVAMRLLFRPYHPPQYTVAPPEFRQYSPLRLDDFIRQDAWWSARPETFRYQPPSPEQITGRPWPSRTVPAAGASAAVPPAQAAPAPKPAPAPPAAPQETAPPPAPPPRQDQPGELTPLEIAVYRYSEGDKELARAMLMGALMEGGNLTGPWNSGDNGQSHGPYQIYQGAHAGLITPAESNDPDIATRFMLPKYKAALASLRREQPDIFRTDPYLAAAIVAYRAERPAAMYPVKRQQWARSVLEKRFRE